MAGKRGWVCESQFKIKVRNTDPGPFTGYEG